VWCEQRPQRLARTVQSHFHGIGRAFEHFRSLLGIQFFDVTKHQNGTVGLRQLGDGATNESARLGAFHRRIHRLGPGRKLLGMMAIVLKGGEQRLDGVFAFAAPAAKFHQGGVDGDAMQPGGKPRLAGKARQISKGEEKRILQRVARVIFDAEDPARDCQQTPGFGADQLIVCRGLPGAQPREKSGLIGHSSHSMREGGTVRLCLSGVRIHLINPSHLSFGVAVITPRWLYVLAAATPTSMGDPIIVDETLVAFDPTTVNKGDVVGIGIHSGNALRGYEVGRLARDRGAWVVFGGIHATLYPAEAPELGGAHAVVKGDGDGVWSAVVNDCVRGTPQPLYEGGRVEGGSMLKARWDLLPPDRYMWASVQTVRGCPKHCSFCSVWRTDGQKPRVRSSDAVVEEIVELRRKGFRFIALADDNFYPVTLEDLRMADRRADRSTYNRLKGIRDERYELMSRLAKLPKDMVFFTQITMEAAEDTSFLDAMREANIKGALVGVEAVTPAGLKDIYKDFNLVGDDLAARLQTFRRHGVHVLGSFIFGLPSDRPETFDATAALAEKAGITFAQFVMLTPFPGTIDFERWEEKMAVEETRIAGIPITRHWLIPQEKRPKVYSEHPVMSPDEIRARTQAVWDRFYSLPKIWERSQCVKSFKSRMTFVLISKLYRQMYANTGIATDSARVSRAEKWARLLAPPTRRLFAAKPMPELQVPS
jgi:radical SAM superfamily enzyme YgiQ (UPF0313 family)